MSLDIDALRNEKVRILGISGSPRHGTTDYLTELALESAATASGIETDFLPLHKVKINHCIQCERCLKLDPGQSYEHYCPPFHDDMDELIPRFLAADGYIIASPVYEMNYTPLLGIFMGRFRPLWRVFKGVHRNKVGGAISVGGTRYGGQETTVQLINSFFLLNEMINVSGTSGGYIGACAWSQDKLPPEFNDPSGEEKVRDLGRRVAEVTKIVKAGRAIFPDGRPNLDSLDENPVAE
ncbi:MAG: flavodoxin family protein [Clostridiales Family XIII bacterium]|jgi:multimeric flavodoxin WrbA|nr:flavodoxin family protein [Clostridiales Family XIII bacterium]